MSGLLITNYSLYINRDQWCRRSAHLSEKQKGTVQFGFDPQKMIHSVMV